MCSGKYYEDDIPKLSKANSFAKNGLAFWLKTERGVCVAYEYKTKRNIAVHIKGKDALVSWIDKNIDEIKTRLENEKC